MTSNWLFNALYESNEPHCVWGAVLCLSLELFSFVLVFRCRQLLYSNISQGLGKKGERLLKILPQVGNVSWSPIFLILWKLSKFELPLFLFLLSGTPVLDAFPCSLPVTFCMTASNMKTPSVQLPLPSFQKLMKCVSHPCREDLSSNQGLEEVKYSGKCSCFPSSCQICSIPLLVLLQDAFPEENSPVSVAGRENCSLRDE